MLDRSHTQKHNESVLHSQNSNENLFVCQVSLYWINWIMHRLLQRPMNTLNDLFLPHTPANLTTDQPAEQEESNQSVPHRADEAEPSTISLLRLPGAGKTRQQGQKHTKHSTNQHIHWDIVLLGAVFEVNGTCGDRQHKITLNNWRYQKGINTVLTFTATHLLQSEQWEYPVRVVLKSLKCKSVQN